MHHRQIEIVRVHNAVVITTLKTNLIKTATSKYVIKDVMKSLLTLNDYNRDDEYSIMTIMINKHAREKT